MECHGISRAFQHADVNIGWYPFVAKGPSGVRSKPGSGVLLGDLASGEGFARQSVRNPQRLDSPPLRAAVVGLDGRRYVWGYRRFGAITGWVREDHVKPDDDFARKPHCNGPASMDFEVGRGKATAGAASGCGKVSVLKRTRPITAREVHLRYSPHGTSYHYLHRGNTVRVLIVKGPQGNVFVEVAQASPDGSVQRGTRGWMSVAALA